ncbi:MAG TPA: hypothetical protein VGW11_11180 [Solirubrobacteraceae bacterium]|nr:hypothetical protein [Solirubrobacteraceae bacterium]
MSSAPDRDGRTPEAEATDGAEEQIASFFAAPSPAEPVAPGAATGLGAGAVGVGAPEPTPVIPVSESSFRQPPGTALPSDQPAETGDLASRPEVLAGAAFAGGLAVAMLIRRALS